MWNTLQEEFLPNGAIVIVAALPYSDIEIAEQMHLP